MTTETDVATIRMIIRSAVLIALFCLLAGIALAMNAANENPVIVAASGALMSVPGSCVTGLFGLLAKTSTTRTGGEHPQPVTVENNADHAVPVKEG